MTDPRADPQPIEPASLPDRLHTALDELTAAPELRPILASIAACAQSATEASSAIVVVCEDGRPRLLEAVGVDGYTEGAKALVLTALGAAESPLTEVLRTGQPLVVPDVFGDTRFAMDGRDLVHDVASMVAIPLFGEAGVIGILSVCFGKKQEIGPEVLDMLTAFTHLIVTTLANEHSRANVERLEETDRRRSELLGTVAHELRAPIQASIGFVATVLTHWDRLTEGERKALLQRVATSSDEQARLVDDLLDLSRLEKEHSDVHPRDCDISAEIDARVASLEPIFADHQLVVKVPPGIRAFFDPDLLSTILSNLLTNAIKYSPPGSTVELTAAARNGETIVSVGDQGQGIEEEEQRRIFEPFYQSGGHTSESAGAGLGLALVSRCVDLLGGRIWVESTVGRGSTFAFSVPTNAPA